MIIDGYRINNNLFTEKYMAFEQVQSVESLDLRVGDDVALLAVPKTAEVSDAEIDTELVTLMKEQGQGIAEHVKLFGEGSQPEWRGAHFVLPLHENVHAGFLEALGLEPYCPLGDTELRASPATVVSERPIIESREATAEVVLPTHPHVILKRIARISETPAVSGQEENRKVQAMLSYIALRRDVALNLVD